MEMLGVIQPNYLVLVNRVVIVAFLFTSVNFCVSGMSVHFSLVVFLYFCKAVILF